MRQDFATELRGTALPLVTVWLALWSWRGLVEESRHFLGPALMGGVLIALAGAAGRTLRLRWYAVTGLELVTALVFANHNAAQHGGSHAGPLTSWIPTVSSLTRLFELVREGFVALNRYYSPVGSEIHQVYPALLGCILALLILTDLIARGWRLAPLTGMVVLAIWMVPISVLSAGVSIVVFLATAASFLLMLAGNETRRLLGWAGRENTGSFHSPDLMVNGRSLHLAAGRIGAVTCLLALVVPLGIPLAHASLSDLARGSDGARGGGGTREVQILSPMIDLRRDLAAMTHTPLLRVRTDDPAPEYVRVSVLDQFDGSSWKPSPRTLPKGNRVDGQVLPIPPGLLPTTPRTLRSWQLRTLPDFQTAWLPAPYPVRNMKVDNGDWRYDRRTLDFANADGDPTADEVDYQLTAFSPEITPRALDNALVSPESIRGPMTQLPEDLPDVVQRTAARVTAQENTNYGRAVALQDWFRSTGGFRYSISRGPGSGEARLVDFITKDKVGYCEQFAAAMATLGRSVGIPSRVVVGFLRPQETGAEEYLFTSDDLHAWPEMYFSGIGWVGFEPTPGTRTGQPPAYTSGDLQQDPALPQPTVGPTGTPKPIPAPLPGSGAAGSGSSTLGSWGWIPAGAVLALCCWVPMLLRRSVRRRRLAPDDARALAAGAWAEVRATAVDLRIEWRAGHSAREQGLAMLHWLGPDRQTRREIDLLVEFVERARYARPFVIDEQTAARIRSATTAICALLHDSVPSSQARWARLLPRSLWSTGFGGRFTDPGRGGAANAARGAA